MTTSISQRPIQIPPWPVISFPMHKLGYVCVIGNDGCGKSTLAQLITQHSPCLGLERSMKQADDPRVRGLVQQIKKLDQLTYSYGFEDAWYEFEPTRVIEIDGVMVPVFWVFMQAPVDVLQKRIAKRTEMTVYQHQKCIKYFNYVYLELAYFYGLDIVNANQPIQAVLAQIMECIGSKHHRLALKDITLQKIMDNNLETMIQAQLTPGAARAIYEGQVVKDMEKSGMTGFYFPMLGQNLSEELMRVLASRWVQENASRVMEEGRLILKYSLGDQTQEELTIRMKSDYLFEQITEGQSKILYKVVSTSPLLASHFSEKVLIFLKSTVYSHKKQSCGEISELGKIRAKGSMIFLQMLKRNHIDHSYIVINKQGIILSRCVETNEIEIVFKKQCLGTDKYSYSGIRANRSICDEHGRYQGGIYVRFDWRNPNHELVSAPQLVLNLDAYYYPVEKYYGKEKFFSQFILRENCRPIGDKCISEDVIAMQVNTQKIKMKVIEAYLAFEYYANQVGLEILDGCMMIDAKCQYIWSEINPDCLRVKALADGQDYDKDIWRAGGSSSKELITQKWSLFNTIFIKYFQMNRFMDSEMKTQLLSKQLYAQKIMDTSPIRPSYLHFYRQIIRGRRQRQVIGTIDIINGQPILVESSQFKQKHSSGKIQQALDFISLMPQVLIVDIDGAMGKQPNNKPLIQQLRCNQNVNFYAVGGGIRDQKTAKDYLGLFQHIVISSNLELISSIPAPQRHRIIVQLSLNQKCQILTHSRTVNTGVTLASKLPELVQLGIRTISITFHCQEGKLQGLPRQQIREIMYSMPGPIEKVIIAGGITTIDDLEFLWGYEKVVPQLGSAIWKHRLHIGDIYKLMLRYGEDGLVPAVIQDAQGKNLGLIYMDQQSIYKTCDQRVLYRYSRQHQRVMKKGEISGNTQRVLSINIDCDNDSLLIKVATQHPIFCHLNSGSCFYQQTVQDSHKTLSQIQQHIAETRKGGGSGYSHKIQNSPKLAITKILQQAEQLNLAQSSQHKLQQCADLFAHTLMYMNSQDISIADVLAVLNKRTKIVKTDVIESLKPAEDCIRVGLGVGKHSKLIYGFMEECLGVKILPHPEGKERNYNLNYNIVDPEKLQKVLNVQSIHNILLVSVKPKDMVKMMHKKYINFGVNYSNVVEDQADNFSVLASRQVQGLRVALIKRQGEHIDLSSWSALNKGLIVSEYPCNIAAYLSSKGIPSSHYSLIRVSGHSEGFLSDRKFHYCDAIVHSGKTIRDNNLEIECILKEQIQVILFKIE